MSEYVLKTSNLTKRYGSQLAVNNVSLKVKKGEIYGLVGKNGAGKSTLIKMITSLSSPTSGKIELLGESSAAGLAEARKRVGCIIESPTFYKKLSAKDNLEYFRLQRGIKDKSVINKSLDIVNLAHTGNKKFGNFSLGMKQRLGLALAIMDKPEFVILDEPVNGLDPTGIVEIRETIKNLREKGITVMISSHILVELSLIATDYGFINNGSLIKSLTKDQLDAECTNYIKLLVPDGLRAKNVLDQNLVGKKAELVSPNELHISKEGTSVDYILNILTKNNISIHSFTEVTSSLEDYFIDLIKEVA